MCNAHDGLYEVHAVVEFFQQFCFVRSTPNIGVGGVCLFFASAVWQLARGEKFTHFATATKLVHECGVEPRLVYTQRWVHHEPVAIETLNVVSFIGGTITPNIDVVALHCANQKGASDGTTKSSGVEICFASSGDMERSTLQCNEAFANKFFTAVDEARKLGTVLFGAVRYLVELGFVGLAKICGIAIRQCTFFTHPCHSSRGIESARKSNTHAFPDGELREDFRARGGGIVTGHGSYRTE